MGRRFGTVQVLEEQFVVVDEGGNMFLTFRLNERWRTAGLMWDVDDYGGIVFITATALSGTAKGNTVWAAMLAEGVTGNWEEDRGDAGRDGLVEVLHALTREPIPTEETLAAFEKARVSKQNTPHAAVTLIRDHAAMVKKHYRTVVIGDSKLLLIDRVSGDSALLEEVPNKKEGEWYRIQELLNDTHIVPIIERLRNTADAKAQLLFFYGLAPGETEQVGGCWEWVPAEEKKKSLRDPRYIPYVTVIGQLDDVLVTHAANAIRNGDVTHLAGVRFGQPSEFWDAAYGAEGEQVFQIAYPVAVTDDGPRSRSKSKSQPKPQVKPLRLGVYCAPGEEVHCAVLLRIRPGKDDEGACLVGFTVSRSQKGQQLHTILPYRGPWKFYLSPEGEYWIYSFPSSKGA